jgi:hypothetical protein
MGLDTKTHWLTDRQSQCYFDFDLAVSSEFRIEVKSEKWSGENTESVWAVMIECNCDTDVK